MLAELNTHPVIMHPWYNVPCNTETCPKVKYQYDVKN